MNKLFRPFANERGVAMVVEVVLAAVVLVAGGYAVYRVTNHAKSTTSNTSTTTASASADSSCLATYHDADLCHFASNSTSLYKLSYTATLTVVQAGVSSTMTLENDGKGDTSLSGSSDGSQFNSIQLSGATYLEDNGTWIKYPSGASAPVPTNPTSSMNIGVGSAGISYYKKVDTEACGSLTCFKYQVVDTAAPGTTQFAWFDNSSYKLRQWKETDSSGNSTDMTVSYGPLTIAAPASAEDFSTAAGQ